MKTLDLVFAYQRGNFQEGARGGADMSPLLEALDGNYYRVVRIFDNGDPEEGRAADVRYVLRDEKTGNWCTAPLRSEAMDIVLDNRGMVPAP